MERKYEAPELTLIGEADEVVLGVGDGISDFPNETAADFEFEQD
jgi:hypothetical protein